MPDVQVLPPAYSSDSGLCAFLCDRESLMYPLWLPVFDDEALASRAANLLRIARAEGDVQVDMIAGGRFKICYGRDTPDAPFIVMAMAARFHPAAHVYAQWVARHGRCTSDITIIELSDLVRSK